MIKLSALVCVQGEEPLLADCLRRLAFCDEIVLVADRATPRLQEIARRCDATLIAGIFPLESQRKSAGAEACGGDWILEIEADELVGSALAWEIRASLQMRPRGDWFEIPMANHVGETMVRRGWGTPLAAVRAPRLYRRGVKHWRAERRAGAPQLSGAPAGALKGALRRQVAGDVGGLMERLNRLSAQRAEDLADAGQVGGLGGGLAVGLGDAFGAYVLRGGWREGRLGLTAALMAGLYPVLVRLRTREILDARKQADAVPAAAPQLLRLGVR